MPDTTYMKEALRQDFKAWSLSSKYSIFQCITFCGAIFVLWTLILLYYDLWTYFAYRIKFHFFSIAQRALYSHPGLTSTLGFQLSLPHTAYILSQWFSTLTTCGTLEGELLKTLMWRSHPRKIKSELCSFKSLNE